MFARYRVPEYWIVDPVAESIEIYELRDAAYEMTVKAVAAADAIFVCVPTPITTTKDPDLAPVLAAAESIRGGLRAGHLIVLQSTTWPGTTAGPSFRPPSRLGAPTN